MADIQYMWIECQFADYYTMSLWSQVTAGRHTQPQVQEPSPYWSLHFNPKKKNASITSAKLCILYVVHVCILYFRTSQFLFQRRKIQSSREFLIHRNL